MINEVISRRIISKNLKRLRVKNGLTLKEASEKLGFPMGSLGIYENGYCKPSKKRIERLAEFYGVTEEYLYSMHKPKAFYQNEDIGLAVIVWNGVDWELRSVTPLTDDLMERLTGHEIEQLIKTEKKPVKKKREPYLYLWDQKEDTK